ncbi:hypothetical protein B0T25DRAFT_579097 [Lasiosphaeria hispida]|uniref:F-box domain-containing protein n=1 Tax=Lasiosphaeria hispida TaxID=260671 RepID=A0AAJ0HLH4_9PEZI|nr:hypothetical protein B0T25DRAFT_579097 [Lasiosphaeria hispida]
MGTSPVGTGGSPSATASPPIAPTPLSVSSTSLPASSTSLSVASTIPPVASTSLSAAVIPLPLPGTTTTTSDAAETATDDKLVLALLVKRRQNSEALIWRLPVEIILKIMKEVATDPVSLYILRQTASIFAQLFCASIFSAHHVIDPSETVWIRRSDSMTLDDLAKPSKTWPFVAFAARFLDRNQRLRIRQVLRRDTLCEKCALFPESVKRELVTRLGQAMHCHGCAFPHPRIMFSHTQRNETQPICIGREGAVRLCPHRKMTFSQIEGWYNEGLDGHRIFPIHDMECSRCFDEFKCLVPLDSPLPLGDGVTCQPKLCLEYPRPMRGPCPRLHRTWQFPLIKFEDGEPLDERRMKEVLAMEAKNAEAIVRVCHLHPHTGSQLVAPGDECKCTAGWRPPTRAESKAQEPLRLGKGQRTAHGYCCRFCLASYEWLRKGNVFWLLFHQEIFIHDSYSLVANSLDSSERSQDNKRKFFLQSIDPASYEHHLDKEVQNISWCCNPTCSNANFPGRHELLRDTLNRRVITGNTAHLRAPIGIDITDEWRQRRRENALGASKGGPECTMIGVL